MTHHDPTVTSFYHTPYSMLEMLHLTRTEELFFLDFLISSLSAQLTPPFLTSAQPSPLPTLHQQALTDICLMNVLHFHISAQLGVMASAGDKV